MKLIKELRKNNKKGFTLVELIVVLVILAILAALLIPTLTGYIDKAKEKDVIAKTRQAVMATQTLVDEAYAKVDVGGSVTVGTNEDTDIVTVKKIAALAEVDDTKISGIEIGSAKVTKLVYTDKKKVCTYSNGEYTVTDKK